MTDEEETCIMTTLTGRALKVTIVLDPAEVLTLRIPDGSSRMILKIAAGGRTATADIAAKSLRKAQTTIREAGSDGCAAILQGKLGAGDVVSEAGLVAQIKAAKDAAAPAAAEADKASASPAANKPPPSPNPFRNGGQLSAAEIEKRKEALAASTASTER